MMGTTTAVTDNVDDDSIVVHADALSCYGKWPAPTIIVSDGAYGVDGFPTDTSDPSALREWYEPHVEAWSEEATPETTLWFWNTELGWANVHPLLEEHGWEYRGCNVWNKGVGHIAGNANTDTLRKFPQVTEVCVQYVRSKEAVLSLEDEQRTVQEWLRDEWQRAGLTFQEANDACGVKSAATRKYFAADEKWYFPPPERFRQLREYVNEHGDPNGRPYLSSDGVLGEPTFDCPHGVTNVWDHSQVRGEERIELPDGTPHPNQKPLALMERIVEVASEEGDVVWEPFGGLCTASQAALNLDREPYAAEIENVYVNAARDRLEES